MNKIFLLIAFLFSSTFSISSFTYPWIINLTGDTATVVKWKSNNDTVKAFCDRAADTITNNSARLDTLEDTIAVHSLKIDSLQDTSSLQSARIDTLEDTVAVHSTHLDAVDDSIDNRYTKSASDDRYLLEAGDTMTGPLALDTNRINRTGSDTLGVFFNAFDNMVLFSGSSGGAALGEQDRFSIISNQQTFINLSTPNNVAAGFLFSDDVRAQGLFSYDHANGWMRFKVEGDEAFYIHPDSAVATNRITSPVIGDTVVDYAATSTVTGWSSFTRKVIRCQKAGKVVTVWFELRGTSNSTTTTFTVPNTPASGVFFDFMFFALDNGGSTVAGWGSNSSSTIILYSTLAGDAWTASGTKYAYGQFTYFID